jgi:hypothetical protein
MSFLSTVDLIDHQTGVDRSPAYLRRQKLTAKIDQQFALLADSGFGPTRHTWQKASDGSRVLVEKGIRLKRWWVKQADGKLILTVRYGSRPLQLAEGRNAILVVDEVQLAEVMYKMKAAVSAGEFDVLIESSVNGRKLVFKGKAK